MGNSANSLICYGIKFDNEYIFPWQNEEGDNEIDKWWLKTICKYEPPFELFDKNGEYIDGIRPSEEKIAKYFVSKTNEKK